jgi:hypothetical protein
MWRKATVNYDRFPKDVYRLLENEASNARAGGKPEMGVLTAKKSITV